MKLLHDDKNKMTFGVEDTRSAVQRIVPFNPEWVDGEGLLGNLGQWIMDNMRPGEHYRGVRWVDFQSYDFEIRRRGTDPAEPSAEYIARFTMVNGDTMCVEPGVIAFLQAGSRRLDRRYFLYQWTDRTIWKLDVEVRRHYSRNYSDCPAILAIAYAHMDSMLYDITRVPHQRLHYHVRLDGMSGPTPQNMQKAYHWVYSHYRQGPGGPGGMEPNLELLQEMRRLIAHIVSGSKVPELLYDNNEKPVSPDRAEQTYAAGVDKVLDTYLGGDIPVAQVLRSGLKQHLLELYRSGNVSALENDEP